MRVVSRTYLFCKYLIKVSNKKNVSNLKIQKFEIGKNESPNVEWCKY